MENPRQKVDLVGLLNSGELVKVCAPMVRFTKLPFRQLVLKYGADIAVTPMIMSDSFVRSERVRDLQFTTTTLDTPLVAQFAANNAQDFADAAELVLPYVDGVDLNCGCPQSWAMSDGYGAHLLTSPELIRDMVHQARERTHLPISIKIRVNSDLRRTYDLVRTVESAGVAYITVHGRTTKQRSSTPPDLEAIRLVKEHATVPVLANGDIYSLQDAVSVREKTGVNGVMAARGMLDNPAMFAGYETTPLECVQDFVDFSLSLGTSPSLFRHHLGYMLDSTMMGLDKRHFWSLHSTPAILEFLTDRYSITYNPTNF